MDLDGKVFVITGAARGIGAATAELAASRGASVVVSDVLDDAGQATVGRIRQAGGQAAYAHCDVTVEADVERLMAGAAEAFGGIDVLHNNAGIHEAMIGDDFRFETMPVSVFDRVLAVNLRGAFVCSQKALPYLRASRRGPTIVNAGSTATWVGYPYGLAYGTSKGGIALLTKNLAVALAPYGIRVNCYCPASVDTDMVTEVTSALSAEPATDQPASSNPAAAPDDAHLAAHLVRRIGAPADVAELVCFLASERSSFVNGVVWLIDGGVLAWRDTVDAIGLGGRPPDDRAVGAGGGG
ncbi:MAG TPA: SDR family oxidoreductase [Acidimicrobiales bacterium]|nr:SDR family oxidoreductase [Acidimicrobiales bacterium]